MSLQINNTQQIRDFVFTLNLMNKHSVISFMADIEITTATTSLEIVDRVRINFDGYDNPGMVSIAEENNKLDPKLFPFVFDAKWQQFSFVNKEYLLISDVHKKNPVIGKYQVIIRPV
jgi:hypothetical protein